jgi:hypothetical protein
MQSPRHPHRSAVLARDAATARLRRMTVGAFAGASALAVVFAGVAAGTTHAKKAAVRAVARTAPVSALPAVKVSAPSPTPPGGGTAVAAPAAPVQAPTPAYTPPVVTSGGS